MAASVELLSLQSYKSLSHPTHEIHPNLKSSFSLNPEFVFAQSSDGLHSSFFLCQAAHFPGPRPNPRKQADPASQSTSKILLEIQLLTVRLWRLSKGCGNCVNVYDDIDLGGVASGVSGGLRHPYSPKGMVLSVGENERMFRALTCCRDISFFLVLPFIHLPWRRKTLSEILRPATNAKALGLLSDLLFSRSYE
ncbi:unnamed protein product [Microthlaspi erraticum]|uniref:Uncharacterized protein n=1 Tax=Microthlaspi erraticum TaxID=1685480 RepID=A0A6D2IK88_9BRAS|nr:unnamed protein product [Microthlaspi erraticum]